MKACVPSFDRDQLLDIGAVDPGVLPDVVGGEGGAAAVRRAVREGAVDGQTGEEDASAPGDREPYDGRGVEAVDLGGPEAVRPLAAVAVPHEVLGLPNGV